MGAIFMLRYFLYRTILCMFLMNSVSERIEDALDCATCDNGKENRLVYIITKAPAGDDFGV